MKVSTHYRKKCKEFADHRIEEEAKNGLYSKRGGYKWSDIYSGAIAEFAVHESLKEHGIITGKPDLSLYDAQNKSYDADLKSENYKFHVKSQTLESAIKYGASWLLQRSDPLLKDPKKGEYLVLCSVDLKDSSVSILACVPILTLVNKDLIGECKLKWFRTNKVAIYYEELKKKLRMSEIWSILY